MAHKVRSNLGSYLVLAAVFTTSHHNGRIQPFRNSRPTFWFKRISKRAPLHQDITHPSTKPAVFPVIIHRHACC